MELFYAKDIEGSLVQLDQEESAHCVKVLRHRSGDSVNIIDGRGSLYHCTLLDANPKAATAHVESEEPGFGAHPYHLTMAVCPTKNLDRFEWFAEKATEIGVDVIAPVIGEHSERKVIKTERIDRIVLSASKQSLKGAVPEISEAVSVKQFIETAPEDALKLICYCFEGEQLRQSASELLAGSDADKICILIGPEGDFSLEEASLALAHGWKPVHLGSSRLRTETAAVVATTAVYLSKQQ